MAINKLKQKCWFIYVDDRGNFCSQATLTMRWILLWLHLVYLDIFNFEVVPSCCMCIPLPIVRRSGEGVFILVMLSVINCNDWKVARWFCIHLTNYHFFCISYWMENQRNKFYKLWWSFFAEYAHWKLRFHTGPY